MRITTLLLLPSLLLASGLQAHQREDVSQLITNADFEQLNLLGWNHQGFNCRTEAISSDVGWNKQGQAYAGQRSATHERLPQSGISQTLTLQPGIYTLYASAISWGKDAGRATCFGTHLSAGSFTKSVTDGGDYYLQFVVPQTADVTIGFSCYHTDATWVGVDNFKLFRTTDADACKQYLDSVRQEAVNDTTQSSYRAYRDDLRSVLQKTSVSPTHLTETYQQAAAIDSVLKHIRMDRDLSAQLSNRRAELDEVLPADFPNRAKLLKDIWTAMNKMRRNGEAASGTTYEYWLNLCDSLDDYVEPLAALQTAYNKARVQYIGTNYPGKQTFGEQLDAALRKRKNFTSVNDIKHTTAQLPVYTAQYLATRPSEWITIKNGQLWKTPDGQTVQAHAPGFLRVGDIWYMCGEDRSNSWNPDVNLYSSNDLVHWRFERKIIQNGVTDEALGSSRFIERPKLLYNDKTGKYLVWCHWESSDYGASEAACFECDSVNGQYTKIWSGRPDGIKSRDCNVFQDDDGYSYFISTTEENTNLGLFRLSDDYHSIASHTTLFNGQRREAPAIVKVNGKYFMFNSACSGWDPNQCKYAYSDQIWWGWSSLWNLGNQNAYDTQAAAILTIKGTKATTYLYVGDRWQDPGLPETKTIIFPISFDGNNCTFAYHERFDINFVTGEWRETPEDSSFIDRTNWRVSDYNSEELSSEYAPATNIIDGDWGTYWHTRYSSNPAWAPHYITIDMGANYKVSGFLAVPRMDWSTNGLVRKYKFQVSMDGKDWTTVSTGDWLPYCTEVDFPARTARYICFTSTEGDICSLAELYAVGKPDTTQTAAIKYVNLDNSGNSIVRFFTLDGAPCSHPLPGHVYIRQTLRGNKVVENRKVLIPLNA